MGAQGGLAAHFVGAADRARAHIPVFGAEPRRPSQSGGGRGVPEQYQSVQAECRPIAAGPRGEWRAVPEDESEKVLVKDCPCAMESGEAELNQNGENFSIISFVFWVFFKKKKKKKKKKK